MFKCKNKALPKAFENLFTLEPKKLTSANEKRYTS